MKAWFLPVFLPLASCLPLDVHADAPAISMPVQAAPVDSHGAHPDAMRPSARPSDEAIKAAVRAILDDMPYERPPAGGAALSGAPYKEFSRRFSEAGKGHCLGPDALKHQPASIVVKTIFGDFAVGAGSLLALPFWGAAIARDKCSWRR